MAKNKRTKKDFTLLLIVLPILAIGLSSYAVFKGVSTYITTSSYFNIRGIRIEGITDMRYVDMIKDEIMGSNIFRVNTSRLAEKIRRRFPTFYSVIVTRILPSDLLIVAKERIPVAIVKRDAIYLFDTEGVVVASFESSVTTDFPVITGIDNRLPTLRVGTVYLQPVLRDILKLAHILRSKRFVIADALPMNNKLNITRIEASDPANICFYLGTELAVRVGHEDFENKVSLLPAILKTLSTEIANVKYIDLRPKEPAVAIKKEAGKK